MVKENNEEKIELKAGLAIWDEFKLWVEDNKEYVRKILLNWSEEHMDLYTDHAFAITIIAQKLFLESKGLSYDEDEEIGFGNIIYPSDLFN